SPLRPHCLAKERLLLWCLSNDHQHTTSLPSLFTEVVDHITNMIGASWTDSTKELYSMGLLVFHIFCDLNNILDNLRCP
ncbi:hypothetical protein EDC04DRAFT_2503206, partial [Pisolithus marmoratus]